MTTLAATRVRRPKPGYFARARRAAIRLAVSMGFFVGVAMGLAFPLFAMRLETLFPGGSAAAWAAFGAAVPTVLFTPALPWALTRFGVRTVALGAGALSIASFLIAAWGQDVVLVTLGRFGVGVGSLALFMLTEVWLNRVAPPKRRAEMLGVYAAALAGGLGVGSASFAFTGAEGPSGFILGCIAIGLASVPITARAPRPRPPASHAVGLSAIVRSARRVPLAAAAGMAFGAMETGALNYLPVWATRVELGALSADVWALLPEWLSARVMADPNRAGAGLLLIAAAIGNVALQWPIGWVADRIGRARALVAVAAIGTAMAALIALAPIHLSVVAPLVFLYAGVTVAMYATGLALLGADTPARELAQANAAFVMCYGLGSLMAPVMGWATLRMANPDAIIWALAGATALFLVAAPFLGRPAAARR